MHPLAMDHVLTNYNLWKPLWSILHPINYYLAPAHVHIMFCTLFLGIEEPAQGKDEAMDEALKHVKQWMNRHCTLFLRSFLVVIYLEDQTQIRICCIEWCNLYVMIHLYWMKAIILKLFTVLCMKYIWNVPTIWAWNYTYKCIFWGSFQ